MDQPDIHHVIQWKATCDMCTLWQCFGRAAHNLAIDAEVILFVELALTDVKEAKEQMGISGKHMMAMTPGWAQLRSLMGGRKSCG